MISSPPLAAIVPSPKNLKEPYAMVTNAAAKDALSLTFFWDKLLVLVCVSLLR